MNWRSAVERGSSVDDIDLETDISRRAQRAAPEENAGQGRLPAKAPVKAESHNPAQGRDAKGDDGDDIAIDFSALKAKVKGMFKKEREKTREMPHSSREHSSTGSTEDTFSIDLKEIMVLWNKHKYWIVPTILLLIAIVTSTYFRMMSSSLPITDDWAENTVDNFYRNTVANKINQQYPNLPERNRNTLIDAEFQKLLEQNKEQVERDKAQLSQQYKAQFQDDHGDTYLLAIDPYLWFSQARNVLRHGHLGDTIIDGGSYFSLRDGRLDKRSSFQLHPYIGAYLYKFLHFFKRDLTLMRAIFLMPAIIIGLSLIPAFFITRKVAGNVGGFFAAMFLAINGPLLGRTPAGFSDTDPYNILYPLFIAWLVMEAYTAKSGKTRMALAGGAGLLVGLYAATWTGWSYIFLFILGMVILAVLIRGGIAVFRQKKTLEEFRKGEYFKRNAQIFLAFFLSSGVFVSLFQSFANFLNSFLRPIKFIALKEVGVRTIWPNVLTTVAEFNTISFSDVIRQMGGTLLFAIAILGVLFTVLKKDHEGNREVRYLILTVLWFTGTVYAFTKGVRFSILMAPPFALAIGFALGTIYEKGGNWLHKSIKLDEHLGKGLVFIVMALLLISPFSAAKSISKNEVPSMNDAWHDLLTKIKDDSDDSIITSWWDFGHWFQSIAERRVTFDGGDQGERIHWVGRTLQTDSEQEAIGILRMLNCAQETAPHTLERFGFPNLTGIKILKEAILQDRTAALQTYQRQGLSEEQIQILIEQTHCEDLLPNYYITSEDMVCKAGVWGHFGSWSFDRAFMYQNTRQLPRADAVQYLTSTFNLTAEDADRIHNEIRTTKGDRWIASWPGYLAGWQGCSQEEAVLRCPGSLQGTPLTFFVNLSTHEVTIEGSEQHPNTIVYATTDGVEKKEFPGPKTGFSFILAPRGDSYYYMLADPLQAGSIFTRLFFLEGHGLKCFSTFDDRQQMAGGRIITWKVDYQCAQENRVFFVDEAVVDEADEA